MNDHLASLKFRIAAQRDAIFASEILKSSDTARTSVVRYSDTIDAALTDAFCGTIPADQQEKTCLVALGGYGRRELCPFSDIDILIIRDKAASSEAVAGAVRSFWDMGLTMGCVVRTLEECVAILGQDFATDCAYLESRFLAGNPALFLRLVHRGIAPYFKKRQDVVISQFSATVHEGLFSAANTLYRIEPDLKNGICTLRDCQRFFWSERIRNGIGAPIKKKNEAIHWSPEHYEPFLAGYAFLLQLRSAEHMVCGRRQDILETGIQSQVAAYIGAASNAELMERFFLSVRNIRLFLLLWLETRPNIAGPWSALRHRLSSVSILPGIAVCEGILLLQKEGVMISFDTVMILSIFSEALKYQATLSVELRNRIRTTIATIPADSFRTVAVGTIFRQILSSPAKIGHIMHIMHETGVLSKIIPQFSALTCKVQYDSYHEYTIDQHILMALAAIDELPKDSDMRIRSIFASLDGPFILRCAALLHDLGKALPGDHVRNGTVIAETICELLGLSGEDTGVLRFLIYFHIDLSNLTNKEPSESEVQRLAETAKTGRALALLYLLTVVDIRSVGSRAWTGWKAFQIDKVYSRLVAAQSGNPASAHGSGRSGFSYEADTLPEERVIHTKWLAQVPSGGSLALYHEELAGFECLSVCGKDRVGFLGDLLGCLTSEGYNILSARIYTFDDGSVLDIFYVEPPANPLLAPQKHIDSIVRKWNDISQKKITADQLVSIRKKQYPPPPLRIDPSAAKTMVAVDSGSSQYYTAITIQTPDNFGLVYTIARSLSDHAVNIHAARLSTRIDTAVDVFYVSGVDGKKIDSVEIRERLEQNLKDVLTR